MRCSPACQSAGSSTAAVVILVLGLAAGPGPGQTARAAAGQMSGGVQPDTVRDGEGTPRLRRRLTQCPAPVIVTEPESLTIPNGGSATLTIAATGLAPLSYQWYRGVAGDASAPVGTDLPSFTTPVLDATTSYWVRISNACGHASSQTALVTVSGVPAQEITVFLGADHTVPLVLVRISGGTPFMMGAPPRERGSSPDEMPRHQVTIAQDFYLGKYEVTQAQWHAVMGTSPAQYFGIGADYPVYDVSWSTVAGVGGFIETLNQAQGTTKFRLPTEAEWEYAARAGTTTEFSHPAPSDWETECGGFPAAEPSMWWCGNAGASAHPVGEKLANPWGLFDMHGGVWEWVEDRWHDDYTGDPPTDGSAWVVPTGATRRVLRGGSWHSDASACRSAQRYNYYQDLWGHGILGFRLARSQ